MQTFFFEKIPVDLQIETKSFLSAEMRFKRFSVLNKTYQLQAVLALLKEGESAWPIQRIFLQYYMNNPALFAWLNRHANVIEPMLLTLSKGSYVDAGMQSNLQWMRRKLMLSQAPQQTAFEAIKAKLNAPNAAMLLYACVVNELKTQALDEKQASVLLPLLKPHLNSRNSEVRMAAIKVHFLLLLKLLESTKQFDQVLLEASASLREEYFLNLCNIAEKFDAKQAVSFSRKLKKYHTDDNDSVREEAIKAYLALLPKLDRAKKFRRLKPLLDHPSKSIFILACDALTSDAKHFDTTQTGKLLIILEQHLTDADSDVCWAVARAYCALLEKLEIFESASLLKQLLDSPRKRVYEQACMAIALLAPKIDEQHATMFLSLTCNFLLSEDSFVKEATEKVYRALLPKLNVLKSTSILQRMCEESEEKCISACMIIGFISKGFDVQQTKILLSLLDKYVREHNSKVSAAAIRASLELLTRLGVAENVGLLEEWLCSTEGKVRKYVFRAIENIANKLNTQQINHFLVILEKYFQDSDHDVCRRVRSTCKALLSVLQPFERVKFLLALLDKALGQNYEHICKLIAAYARDFSPDQATMLLPRLRKLMDNTDSYESHCATKAYLAFLNKQDIADAAVLLENLLASCCTRLRQQVWGAIASKELKLDIKHIPRLLSLLKNDLNQKNYDLQTSAVFSCLTLLKKLDFTEYASLVDELLIAVKACLTIDDKHTSPNEFAFDLLSAILAKLKKADRSKYFIIFHQAIRLNVFIVGAVYRAVFKLIPSLDAEEILIFLPILKSYITSIIFHEKAIPITKIAMGKCNDAICNSLKSELISWLRNENETLRRRALELATILIERELWSQADTNLLPCNLEAKTLLQILTWSDEANSMTVPAESTQINVFRPT